MNWKKEFKKANLMRYGTFNGFYDVKIVSGLFRLLTPISWIKFVNNVSGKGWNDMDTKRQGHFTVFYTLMGARLKYNIPENEGTPWLRCKDYLKKMENSDVLIGQIQVKICRKYRNMGYFTLTKIKIEGEK